MHQKKGIRIVMADLFILAAVWILFKCVSTAVFLVKGGTLM